MLTSVQLVPLYCSVFAVIPGFAPPEDNADVDVPAPATPLVAVFKLLTSVQELPFQSSVFAVSLGADPAKAKASVFVPAVALPKLSLPVFKSATSVQLDPFQDSVNDLTGLPPKANAAV